MKNAYLILRLDSSFQSFSANRTEKLISTSLFPTKSAIIGLLGCALGYPRGDKRLIELCNNLKIAVRMDKNNQKLVDFQTIHGGYIISQSGLTSKIEVYTSGKNKGKKKCGHLTAESVQSIKLGEHPSYGISVENKLINKEYLMDNVYTIILEGSKQVLETCLEALKNPYWVYTYGRNNCIPSVPIVGSEIPIREDFESLQEALERVPIFERAKKYLHGKDNFLYELEVTDEEKKNYPVNTLIEVYDNTGEYVNYNYRKRYIYRGTVKVKNVSRDIFVKEN